MDDTKNGYDAGTEKKAKQIIGFVNAALVFRMAEAGLENDLYDVNAYGKSHPDSDLGKEANENYTKSQDALNKAKTEYERTSKEIGT